MPSNTIPETTTDVPSSSQLQTTASAPVPKHNSLSTHPMVTRTKTGKLKPKVFLASVEPASVKQALNDTIWKQAMQIEYDALMNNKTWSLTTLPPHRKAIGCKWVFKLKQNPDGTINKHKARLVAKGFHQVEGKDFTETFSPVVKPTTIRIIFTLALTNKWVMRQIDINNAFINGLLEEEIYMTQPQGFEAADKSLVCKLNRALYGLKQAPRAWYERLQQALLKFGFSASKCDASLFVFSSKGITLYALVYVDDIILTGNSPSLIQQLVTKLNNTFALKDLGEPDYFLGIEVKTLPNGCMLMNQAKYIQDLLQRANMTGCNGMTTPMLSSPNLSKHGSDTLLDQHLYRSIVGALQYVTLTRPDIAYSVNKLCQFLANPLESHWKAAKRVLRYLSGTRHHGLLLQPAPSDQKYSLRIYCDSDWASDPDDRRSTSGLCAFLGPNLISWSAKKQSLVAKSSAEAEYRSMTQATAELLWIQSLLTELKIPFQSPTLLCDNMSAVMMAHNPVLHSRTKHIELDLHFVRERVAAKTLSVKHVPSPMQIADILTKPLGSTAFSLLRSKLKVRNLHELEGGILENKDSPIGPSSTKEAKAQVQPNGSQQSKVNI